MNLSQTLLGPHYKDLSSLALGLSKALLDKDNTSHIALRSVNAALNKQADLAGVDGLQDQSRRTHRQTVVDRLMAGW